ncbi:MAG TPA: DoxX family protein [Planctomycetaceae bacterium]|nr:DoxX family protein [Planctomycetaceae bacterium]
MQKNHRESTGAYFAVSRTLLAIFMIMAGTMHFVNPDFFLKIMPPYLPLHQELVLASGVCEILLGVLLLVPRYSHLAAWGIIALLIAVFPANIYLYRHQEILPASPILHLLRLPLQGVFILWAYWHTKGRKQVS